MIPLSTIRVAAPCSADWEQMDGDKQARFCNTCRKNVYNLSAMTEAEAQALVNRHEGKLCVRFYTRADGTLLTQDCTVGLRAMRRKMIRKLSYAAALLVSCGMGLLRGAEATQAVSHHTKLQQTKPKQIKPGKSSVVPAKTTLTRTMGKIAMPKPPVPKSEPFGTAYLGGMMAPPATMGVPTVPKTPR